MVKEKQIKMPNATDKYAGVKLREIRKDKNISQRELASKIGVTFQQVQKYETGVNRMSVGIVYDICVALETSPVAFLQESFKGLKVAEDSNQQLVDEIINSVKTLSMAEQKKLLQYVRKLVKNKELNKEK